MLLAASQKYVHITLNILAGIIDTDPTKHIKVSRKLGPENVSWAGLATGAGHLMEVTLEDAPNVLTNDPDFFAHKKGEEKLRLLLHIRVWMISEQI